MTLTARSQALLGNALLPSSASRLLSAGGRAVPGAWAKRSFATGVPKQSLGTRVWADLLAEGPGE